MPLARSQRRIVGYLTLAAWLFALACTSAYACELGAPVQDDCCATSTSIDAQCSTRCALEGQAPTLGWPNLSQPALAAPALRVAAPALRVAAPALRVAALAPVLSTHPPPDARGASPPLTILLLCLRN